MRRAAGAGGAAAGARGCGRAAAAQGPAAVPGAPSRACTRRARVCAELTAGPASPRGRKLPVPDVHRWRVLHARAGAGSAAERRRLGLRVRVSQSWNESHHPATPPQDTDYAVRICMCWQLPALARALGREAAAEKLLPEALEVGSHLMRDLQAAGLASLLACMDVLSGARGLQPSRPRTSDQMSNTQACWCKDLLVTSMSRRACHTHAFEACSRPNICSACAETMRCMRTAGQG